MPIARFGSVLSSLRMGWQHPANEGRRVRSTARTVAHEVGTRVLGLPAHATLAPGVRIMGPSRSIVSQVVRESPPFWEEMRFWERTLRPGDRFIDVGANVGLYTLWAARLGVEVVAVEPSRLEVAYLRLNLAMNGFDADIREAVLSSDAGTARLSIGHGVENRIVEEGPGVEVAALTLDDVVAGQPTRGVKIDVEGAEALVLEGGAHSLSQGLIEVLQVEWNQCARTNFRDTRQASEEILRAGGYVPRRPVSGRLEPATTEESAADLFWVRE